MPSTCEDRHLGALSDDLTRRDYSSAFFAESNRERISPLTSTTSKRGGQRCSLSGAEQPAQAFRVAILEGLRPEAG